MKAALISIDGLDHEDLPVFSRTESLGRLIASAQIARSMAITPAQTYPCHASVLSGCYPEHTGVIDNLSHPDLSWQWWRSAIRTPILTDWARNAGLSTAAVCFPMTAGADIDFLVPEIWTENAGDDTDPVFRASCSEKGYRYYLRHKDRLDWMRTPGMDLFASAVFEDIIREEQPDLALLHLSYLDHQKHLHGPSAASVPHAVAFIDGLMNGVLDALGDDYMVFIIGDHGHRPQARPLSIPAEGMVVHPTGMSAEIYLDGMGEDEAVSYLRGVDGVGRVYGKDELSCLHLPASFDIFVVADDGCAFSATGKVTPSGHGYAGDDGPYPPFIAYGLPQAFRSTACSLVDEAPTVLKALGIDMPGTDGRPLI